MKVLENIAVPTGNILVVQGHLGPLELVCLGDYGKDVNLNKDRRVEDGLPLMPLTDKWVITISTQYGCSMGCQFCDVPKVGKGVNCTLGDLQQQVIAGLHLHPQVTYSNRLNIHYARMGEPTWNPNVLDHAKWLKDHIDPEYNVHPVLTTMMPRRNEWLKTMLHNWIRIKNRVYRGNAGLQVSINGTNEDERKKMFSGNALTLLEISRLFEGTVPVGRKFTLNFPVANWEINPEVLRQYFDPERFLCKLTPMHKTAQAERFGHVTGGDYTSPHSYQKIAAGLREVGFEVLVFIASEDEDQGMITCGNAILAGAKQPRTRTTPLTFAGGSAVGSNPFKPWDSGSDRFETRLTDAID
jgi:23S rRNA (adenine2503-C2)-methyltransferase